MKVYMLKEIETITYAITNIWVFKNESEAKEKLKLVNSKYHTYEIEEIEVI